MWFQSLNFKYKVHRKLEEAQNIFLRPLLGLIKSFQRNTDSLEQLQAPYVVKDVIQYQ